MGSDEASPAAGPTTLQDRIDAAVRAGQAPAAIAYLRQWFESKPTMSTAASVVATLGKLRAAGAAKLEPYKMFALRSFTVEPLVPLLRAHAALEGLDLEAKAGEFNAWQQELIDPESPLYRMAPQLVMVALQARDVLPELWNGGAALPAGRGRALCEQFLGELRERLTLFRQRCTAQLLLFDFEAPAFAPQGLLDAQSDDGVDALIHFVNQGMRKLCRELGGAAVLDYDAIVARHGRLRWHDERKWLTARMPIAADCLAPLAEECARAIIALRGRTRKVLVCDLDNTLWGGVIGEDGMHGIKISAEYPGAAYQSLQRAILDLAARGVLLAIASKNNEKDAIEVLRDHTEMLLRPEHFAAKRINWNDKSVSLREIASELNVGVDSLVFIDDNPVERERIRGEVPGVGIVELPDDPMLYAQTLRRCPWFEKVSLTSEDRDRTRQYAEQRERAALKENTGSVEGFLHSLEMGLSYGPVDAASLARVAQLTQKTNQFNLTTRRYTEAEVSALSNDPRYAIRWTQVVDRFGDNGIIGVSVARVENAVAEIDTFLMSCRVIGRTVETAMLALLAEEAVAAGARRLQGWFLPTAKNAPAESFYSTHGFSQIDARDAGTLWALELPAPGLAVPHWIRLRRSGG